MLVAIVESAVRAGALQGFDGLVRRLGGEPESLLARHGLGGGALEDPEEIVSLNAVASLLEHAALELQCPDFGLRLGSAQGHDVLGVLAVVIQNATTMSAAIADASRYLFVHSPAYEIVLDDPSPQLPDCVTLRFDVRLELAVPQRQLVDGCLASAYQLTQLLTGIRFRPRGVALPHAPIARPATYRSYFGAPVLFEQAHAGLHLDRALLAADLRSANPDLRRQAVQYIAQRYPPTARGVAWRVRSTLKGTIGANRGTKAEIAGLLDLHPRTLQRRLAAEGATFEQIRDEVYRAAAWRLLTETRIPLSQTALVLGFSEQSAMNRSVRRWFATTPSQIRASRD